MWPHLHSLLRFVQYAALADKVRDLLTNGDLAQMHPWWPVDYLGEMVEFLKSDVVASNSVDKSRIDWRFSPYQLPNEV